jgi:hypothetical protein
VDGGKMGMRLLPSLLHAAASEVAAFRAQMRERFAAPPGTPPDQAERAFDEMADKIIAYLSSPVPSAPDPPYRVGPCTACGKDDCWVSPRSGRQS